MKRTNTHISAVPIGGAVAALVVWLLSAVTGDQPPAEVVAAITTLCIAAAAWLIPGAE